MSAANRLLTTKEAVRGMVATAKEILGKDRLTPLSDGEAALAVALALGSAVQVSPDVVQRIFGASNYAPPEDIDPLGR